jgi:alkyl hydroperoxide reductase subunit F
MAGAAGGDEKYQLIIVGGGPAGLAAGVYAARKMLKALLVSRELGGQVLLSSEIENYLGYPSIRGMQLVGKFEEHLRQYDIGFSLGENVEKIQEENGNFRVVTEGGKSWLTEVVIVATGAKWRTLDVPGERELVGKGVSYCATCDGPLFRGRRVAVVGGGNSGLTAVNDLIEIAQRVYLIELLETLQADPVLVERVRGSEKLEIMLHHEVEAISGSQAGVESLTLKDLGSGETRTVLLHGVFVEIGTIPNSDFVRGLLEINRYGEIATDSHGRTSVAGIFAAGDVTSAPHKQIGIAAGQGANAALCAYDYLLHQGE